MTRILRAIVGPTASGKTDLAIALAKSDPRIILINGDAFAVYSGMEIGTAVPKPNKIAGIDFRLLSFLSPTQEYSIAEFQTECGRLIDESFEKQKIPIIVGGSALYVLSVLNGFNVPKSYPEIRLILESALEEHGTESMYDRLVEIDPVAASRIHPSNTRRLIRALEVFLGSGQKFSDYGPGVTQYLPSRSEDILLVLNPSRGVLNQNIQDRLTDQIKDGFVEEVTNLYRRYDSLSKTAQKAIGYSEILSVIGGHTTLEEALILIAARTRKFSKRQNKWWGRDDRAVFVDPSSCSLNDIKLLLKL